VAAVLVVAPAVAVLAGTRLVTVVAQEAVDKRVRRGLAEVQRGNMEQLLDHTAAAAVVVQTTAAAAAVAVSLAATVVQTLTVAAAVLATYQVQIRQTLAITAAKATLQSQEFKTLRRLHYAN